MSTTAETAHPRRLGAVLREGEQVTPLELFFDLVFVLALTQCTQLMAEQPTWQGMARGLLVLCVMWWAWVGYAWLTSVVDPEEGAVRLVFMGATAAFLVVALCVPEAFGHDGFVFALAYAGVRIAQILLFLVASRDEPALRSSVLGLAVSTAIGVGLLLAASATDGALQGALWLTAVILDMAGPYFFGVEGWKLVPSHFAERHGLIVIIALGESIVAIGAGVSGDIDLAIVTTAVVGVSIAAAQWWLYFDVVALVAERRLSRAAAGREQNSIARDSYSYLHFPMVAGIVLVALGMKKTAGHYDEPLAAVPAVALMGGAALYLLAHVAFRLRNIHTLNRQRLVVAVVLVALIPVATHVDALASVTIVAALLAGLIVYEAVRFAELRDRLRHQLAHH